MAGILDSDFMRFLTNNDSYWRRKDQAQAAEQFQGLLGSLEQQGPTQPGGGVLQARAPDQQFWLKAAMIPEYQQLAGQQLGYGAAGEQAMQRQMQQQQYEGGNLTLMQQMQIRAQQAQDQLAERLGISDLQRKWAGTQASMASSYASAANSGASQQLTMAKLIEQQKKNQADTGNLYSQLTPADRQKANVQLLNADTWANAATDVEDWVQKRGSGAALPLVGTAEADAFNTEWQTSVKPAFMQILNTGVLEKSEAERLEEIMGQPADKVLTQSQINVIKTAAQKVRDLRQNAYKSYGFEAPAVQSGKSAAARQLSPAQPVGNVRPVTAPIGGDGSIWYPVQR